MYQVRTSQTAFLISFSPYIIEIVQLLDCIVFTLFNLTYEMHPYRPKRPFLQIALPISLLILKIQPDCLQAGGQVAGGGGDGEKSETMKKPTRRPGVKPPPDRAKRSIFLFKLKNPIRQFCITVLSSTFPTVTKIIFLPR